MSLKEYLIEPQDNKKYTAIEYRIKEIDHITTLNIFNCIENTVGELILFSITKWKCKIKLFKYTLNFFNIKEEK